MLLGSQSLVASLQHNYLGHDLVDGLRLCPPSLFLVICFSSKLAPS
jgi:hypothetical protein